MKVLQFVSFALFALAGASAIAAPKWDAAHVKEVRFLDGVPGSGREVAAAHAPKEIEEILGYLRRAVEVGKTGPKRDWVKCIDLVGERPERGRWLYDSIAGEFSRLDPMVQRIYRLSDADRVRVNAYFEKKDANQTPEPTRGTGSFLLFQSRWTRAAQL